MTDINRHQDWLDMLERMKASNRIHNKNYHQGYFIPKNWQKCMNVVETLTPIIYRSGWERDFCQYLDENDAFVRWGSECVKILYPNPLTGKMSFYHPDFYIEYIDRTGQYHKELIEIKPRNQAVLKETSNGKDRIEYVKNLKKWEAAIHWCEKRNIKFRVLTQQDLYRA